MVLFFLQMMLIFLSYKQALLEIGYALTLEYYLSNFVGRHYLDFLTSICKNDAKIIESVHSNKKYLYSKNLYKAKKNIHLFSIIESIKDVYYIAIVTSASKKNCEDILKYFEVFSKFDLILTQEDVLKKKPDPEGFLKAMDIFDVKSSETLIFEDSFIGIEAAKKTNATVFVVNQF